jgi:hypothetical protein
MTSKLYESPVRLATYRFTHMAHIADEMGGRTTPKNYLAAHQGYVMELHLRQRIVRIWSTRFPRAKVTTVVLGDNDSWTVEGDEEAAAKAEPEPEGPRAA